MVVANLDIKVSRIHKLTKGGPVMAFVDLVVNDALLLKGLRIVKGSKGLFVSMPQEKGKDDRWYNTIHCLTNETRDFVMRSVLEAYEQGN